MANSKAWPMTRFVPSAVDGGRARRATRGGAVRVRQGRGRRRFSLVQNEANAAARRAAVELWRWQWDAAAGLPPDDSGETLK
jgi:hypothetical protein